MNNAAIRWVLATVALAGVICLSGCDSALQPAARSNTDAPQTQPPTTKAAAAVTTPPAPLPQAATAAAAASSRPVADPAHKPVIYMIGDSTMKNGADDGATMGEWGYGHIMHYYFDESKVSVENDAVGGTSSRTFMEGRTMWPRVLAKLQAGDYVIMQFGHNDNTAASPQTDTLRYRTTIKGNGDETVDGLVQSGGTEVVHSYGWYMRQFCLQTQEKGATPIVVSMIPRNSWSANGKKSRNTGDYAGWAQQAATQVHALFIPLNDLVADEYDKLGRAKVTADLFPAGESTHTTWAGAKLNAQCVAAGIKALKDCPLKDDLLANPKAPDAADSQPGGRRGGRGAPAAGGRGAPATN